jgi:hypothetical protein
VFDVFRGTDWDLDHPGANTIMECNIAMVRYVFAVVGVGDLAHGLVTKLGRHDPE